ncbi:MAG: non-canonical purine NTP pyrophosphatase [Myxococcota bacterium]
MTGWPTELVVATHNPGKLGEWKTLLAPLPCTVRFADEFDLPEPEETEETYVGNATLKALAAAAFTGLPALADDTGFEVSALDGIPGVRTARFAAAQGGYATASASLIEQARAAGDDDHARLVCAVALAFEGEVYVEQDAVEGTLMWPASDLPGFAALLKTPGELSRGGVLEHRRRAFDNLVARMRAG